MKSLYMQEFRGRPFKDMCSCPIEIIKGLTDKGQLLYLASGADLPVYNTVSFIKIKVNILS